MAARGGVAWLFRQGLNLTPRRLGFVEMVSRSRVASFTNPDASGRVLAAVHRLRRIAIARCDRTMAKEELRRRLTPGVYAIVGCGINITPRGLRVVKVVARTWVASLTNPDSSTGAVATGVGRAARKAGSQPKGAQQEP